MWGCDCALVERLAELSFWTIGNDVGGNVMGREADGRQIRDRLLELNMCQVGMFRQIREIA